MKHLFNIFIVSLVILSGCGQKPKAPVKDPIPQKQIITYNFDSDSAFFFVKEQTLFGPRVPGSKAHAECARYLYKTLSRFTDATVIQTYKSRVFDGTVFEGKNIIGSINPNAQKRILLCAHWDSRPYADHDPDPENFNTPIDGANDGASGVGVLLEVARNLSLQKPEIGVDIIFFDLEDYGPPEKLKKENSDEMWGLGSQYWSKNPHKTGYSAYYGVLLDMVGGTNPQFYQEQLSTYFAPRIVNKIWKVAKNLGYEDTFISEQGIIVNDDHLYINQYANIPTIDIIHQNPTDAERPFYKHWHTVNDNIDNIDAESLNIVGTVILAVIAEE